MRLWLFVVALIVSFLAEAHHLATERHSISCSDTGMSAPVEGTSHAPHSAKDHGGEREDDDKRDGIAIARVETHPLVLVPVEAEPVAPEPRASVEARDPARPEPPRGPPVTRTSS